MATANKTLQTRIQLKYDSYENWISNNPVLLKGEIAVATVSVPAEGQTNTPDFQNLPNVVLKVGDGSSHYNDLKFVSGLAADVYKWAKADKKPSYFANEIQGLTEYVQNISDVDTNTEYQLVVVDAETYKYKLQKRVYANNAWGEWADTETLDLSGINTRLGSLEATVEGLTGSSGGIQGAINTAIGALDSDEKQEAGADGLALRVVQVDGAITSISGSIAANTYDAYGAAADVLGSNSDAADANTVYGAKAAAAAAQTAAAAAQKAAEDEATARKAAINALDYNGYVAGNAEGAVISFVGEISETDGVISATKRDLVFTDAYSASNPAATKKYVDDTVRTNVADLTGAMHFEGVFESQPAVDNYSAGDVIIVGQTEYVLSEQDDTKVWIELGNEGAIAAAIQALDSDKYNDVDAGENPVANPAKTITRIVQVDGVITNVESAEIVIDSNHVTVDNQTLTAKLASLAQETTASHEALQREIDANETAIGVLNSGSEVAGSVANKIATAINALDSEVSNTKGTDGLSLTVTQVDGAITSISGSIDPETYDAYGAAKAVQGTTESTVADAMTAAAAAQKAAEDEATARDLAIKALDGSATATATDNGTVNVLTSVVETDGVISKGAEVNLSKVAQSGKVQDLIQDANTYIVFDCGDSVNNI